MKKMNRFKAKIYEADDKTMEGKSMSCNIITDMNKPPKWFVEFVEKQFKPLVQKVSNIEPRLDKIDSRLDNLEKNDKIIFDVLARNNLK